MRDDDTKRSKKVNNELVAMKKWADQLDEKLDEFDIHSNVTDLEAYKIWMEAPEGIRTRLLHNGYCIDCGITSFAPGYAVRRDMFGIVLVGDCSKCGRRIVRQIT